MEIVLGCNQSECAWHSFVCSVAPEDVHLPLILSCRCSIDLLMIFFFVSSLYTDPREHFNSYTPGYLFRINLTLFLHKIFVKLGSVWNATMTFFIFGAVFGIQGKVIVCFLLVLLLLLVVVLGIFFSKLLVIFFNVFPSCPFSQNISVRYFHSQIFFRTDFGSSCKKSFECAGNCVSGYTRMWLNLCVR